MNNTVAESFVQLIEAWGLGTSGQDLFLHRVPNSKQVASDITWITCAGGTPSGYNLTGERLFTYIFNVNVRSTNAKTVEKKLWAFSDKLSCLGCYSLMDHEVISVRVSNFNIRQDLDAEERMYGYIQVQLVVHQTCN